MHAVQLLDCLALLRSNRTFCDIFLQAQEESTGSETSGVWAHRAVLAAASPYFLTLFTTLAENTTPVVIKDVEAAALQAVVEYIYSPASLSVTSANAQALMAAASLLGVEGMYDAVCTSLERTLEANNALAISALAELHDCALLAATARSFIGDNFEHVLQSDQFLALTVDALTALLVSHVVTIKRNIVESAVLRWTQHQPKERFQHFDELLRRVQCVPELPQAVKKVVGESAIPCSENMANKLDSQSLPSSVMLVMGGVKYSSQGTCDVTLCDLSTGRWQSAAPLPEPRELAGAAVIDSHVYLVGGTNNTGYLSSVVMYDVGTDSWMTGPALSVGRIWVGLAALGGVLYAVNGMGAVTFHNLTEALDPREGVWRQISSMPTARYHISVEALGGYLYVVGGYNNGRLNIVERYEPRMDRWETVVPMPETPGETDVAVLDDVLYVVSKQDASLRLRLVQRYRDGLGWEPAPLVHMWNATALGAHAGRLYIAGQRGKRRNIVSNVAMFDPATDVWSDMPFLIPAIPYSSATVMLDGLSLRERVSNEYTCNT